MGRKQRTRSTSLPIGGDARKGLEYTVEYLNSSSAGELRSIIRTWQDSGPNTIKLFGQHPELWAESVKAFQPALMPTRTGGAYLNFVTNMGAEGEIEKLGAAGTRFKAFVLFNSLMLNPLWPKLGGPCERCGKFYIKKRASQKVYCSRQCGNAATALARTRERIERERNDKLDRAKAAMKEWKREKPGDDWRPWVSQRTGIDLRFLTRHQLEITKPTKGR